ncbi:MAG TPA: ABC transporter permease [Bryobacteraceae bacterium]|jgi:predicted permease
MQSNSPWQRFKRRLRFLLSHSERQRLLWEEMEFHIDSMAQDFTSQGMSEDEARSAARRKFGNMTHQSEDSRSVWLVRWLSDLAQDLRYAFRGMRRDAGFTTFVILIAGLGIGASSTIFSVVNAALLRALPFRDSASLVWIANEEWDTMVDHYLDLRERNKSFSGMAGYAGTGVGNLELNEAGGRERLTSSRVTQNFFPLLGLEPAIGRSFTPEECRDKVANPPAVLLSYGFWQRRFASDRDVVGRKLMLNNKPATVIGVMPENFDFASIFAPGTPVDVFVPWPLTKETNGFGNTMQAIGRLRPGATVQSAQAEFTLLAKQLEQQHAERNGLVPRLTPLKQRVSGRYSSALMVLACAVGVVMLIVCANLSNLQLARLGARQKEMSMRAALGAGRLRMLRQMLTESVALSCCGAALGLILAVAGTRSIAHLTAFNIPMLASVRVDAAALGFTLFAAVFSGMLFGLLPALRVRAFAVGEVLKDGGRGSIGAGQKHAWVRNALVVSEIAFACTLLVGAGLLMRSFLRVLDLNLGFQPERAATLRVDPSFRLANAAQRNTYIDGVLQRVRSLPGMRAAGLTDVLPFAGDRAWQVSGQGQVYPKDQHPQSYVRVVSDGYFEALGIRLQSGRGFTSQDRTGSEPVVIINETLARTLWPGQQALGQMMTQDGGRRVVGVVADVRHMSLETTGGSEMYLPMRQTSDFGAMNLVMRTMLPSEGLAAAVRAALKPVDPELPLSEFKMLTDLVDQAMSPRRFLVLLLAGFASFALLLALLGIYAVISYSVNQRVQEIGIRMALGASPAKLQRGILMGTFGLAALGLALGLAASRALSDALGSFLFGVASGDPVTYTAVGALLLVVAALAGYVPAWRASRIDPMVALRSS